MRLAYAGGDVVGMVPGHQQGTAGIDQVGEAPVEVVEQQRRRLEEEDRHQVVAAGRGSAGDQVVAQGLDPVGHPRLGGVLAHPGQGHLGDVECGDPPAAAGEPDGVGALTAADIERPPGREVGALLHQTLVGPAAPDPIGLGVAGIQVSWVYIVSRS